MISHLYIFADRVRDMSHVGSNCQAMTAVSNQITDVIAAVVWYFEGFDPEVTDHKRYFFLDHAARMNQRFLDISAAGDALMNGLGGIDGDVTTFTQTADRLDMVGMVVRHKYSHNLFKFDPPVFQHFFNGSDADAGINQDAVIECTHIITVSAAPAGQAQKK